MQLKNVIESPCGIRYMLDQLELQSGFARRWLLDSPMMTSSEDIAASYAVLHRFNEFVNRVEPLFINTLNHKLCGLKDIRTTIKNLYNHAVLDDIELFEVKHLAILATDVARLLHEHGMDGVVEIPALDEVISILDPDGMKIATFYIYDSYCAQLKDLRAQMRQHPEQQDDLLLKASELEDGVRKDLSQQLHPFATAIEEAQLALARIDVNLAKAMQIKQMGMTFPVLSCDGITRYQAMFHPQVKEALARRGREFQPVDIAFGEQPTLITGANMGEMKNIDAVIKASRENKKLLALIDEPARTTNPTEGAALVTALLKVLAGKDMSLVMTTHYDIEPGDARCLRVKGFVNGAMDYQLVEVQDGEVPHEALNIAQSLGIDSEWITTARTLLETSNQHE